MEQMKNDIPFILIVEDVEENAKRLMNMIGKMGYSARIAGDVKSAIMEVGLELPQLILLDIMLPDVSGYQFCQMLKDSNVTKEIPVIFVSAITSKADMKKVYKLGAVDFISKPVEYMELSTKVNFHLNMNQLNKELASNNMRLSMVVREQAFKIEDEQKRLLKAVSKFAEENKYIGIGNHVENISTNARLLAQALNFTEKYENKISNLFVEAIELAAAIHDIGKISISKEILSKPSSLSDEEFDIIMSHTLNGYHLIEAAYPNMGDNKFIKIASEVVRYHHERWNGEGYPDKLNGEQIPLSARIVTIVDNYDSLLGERCYRKAYKREDALEYMMEQRGGKFDPYILDTFFKIENILKKD